MKVKKDTTLSYPVRNYRKGKLMGYRGFASTKITSDESDTNRRLLRNGFIVVMLLNLNSKRWFFVFIVFHFGVVDVFVLVLRFWVLYLFCSISLCAEIRVLCVSYKYTYKKIKGSYPITWSYPYV